MKDKICPICKKEFTKKDISVYGKEFAKRIYCSQKCMGIGRRAENNPNWKNGSGSVQHGFIRKLKLANNNLCEECDSVKFLEIHHKDKNRLNNKSSNLKVLCRSCHTKTHDKVRSIRGWRKMLGGGAL